MDHALEVMYQAFGLRPGCGADAVHRRYRELAFRLYPDLHLVSGGPDVFRPRRGPNPSEWRTFTAGLRRVASDRT